MLAVTVSGLTLTMAQEQFDAVVVLGTSQDESEVGVADSEISTIEPATLEDLFQNTPSVLVNGGRAQAQQIFVNGIESTFSNVTVDGAPQGNLYHHASTVMIEPELLKQVGINSGAGTALDGLGALNGSIQFETKSAFDFLGEQDFYGMTKAIYYNNPNGYKVSQTLAARLNDNWAVLLSGG